MVPFLPIFVIGLAGAAVLYQQIQPKTSSPAPSPSPTETPTVTPTPVIYTKVEELPDIDPSSQGGDFSNSYDSSFEAASIKTGVPFALLKAHAIRESSLNANAYHADTALKASYGLMQIEWWQNSNRFSKYGYTDDYIGDGSVLYDPDMNCYIGACIILDNMVWLKNLRDAINAYNTGTTEAKHPAPVHYVDDVVKYYNQILGQNLIT